MRAARPVLRRVAWRSTSCAGALLVLGTQASPSFADADEDPKPRAIDPGIAPGPNVVYTARPILSPDVRACSSRVPVCVHARDTRDGATALAVLGAFESGWLTLTGALALPPPDLDPVTLAYDVFLDGRADDSETASTLLEARDVRSRVDRARAFTVLDRHVRAGCWLDTTAATAIARASLYRVAPATEDGTARAQSTYLADLAVPCAIALSADAVHAFQSRPDRAFCDARVEDGRGGRAFAAGAATFWARLDWAFGRNPGTIVPATWALHPTMTPLGAARWSNEPDTFDVLRTTFKGALSTKGTVQELWLDFAIARAFVGDADDGLHLPELGTIGAAARVPSAWDIPWPKTARRFASPVPVHPTGSSYLVVRHQGAAPGARLRAEIDWEEHALFRWAFVKLDAAGRELGRVVIPTTERATQAQMTLVDLDGVDRILLVGVNVGDPAYGFDPDDEIWEPHGWLVTVAED